MEQQKTKPLYIVVGVVVTLAMILGIVALTILPGMKQDEASAPAASAKAENAEAARTTTPAEEPAPAEDAATQPQELSPEQQAQMDEFLRGLPQRDAAETTARGEVDAPVVLIEWADFRCKFCKRFASETLPQLEPYIESGQLRYEFRDFALFGQESLDVAVAARAAGQQGRHYEFMKAYYGASVAEGQVAAPEFLSQVAEQAGVTDLEKFVADLEDPALENEVFRDSQEAQQFGFTSVPMFVIGTEIISGAQPAEVFIEAFEKELAASS